MQKHYFRPRHCEIKASASGREVEILASTYEEDHGGDIILPGAFTEFASKRLMPGHRSGIKLRVEHTFGIGMIHHAEELSGKGWFVKGRVTDTAEFDKHLALAADGVYQASIGYFLYRNDFEIAKKGDRTVRLLKRLDPWEVSFVELPMNEGTEIVSVKSVEALIYGLKNLSERRQAEGKGLWDASYAIENLAALAGMLTYGRTLSKRDAAILHALVDALTLEESEPEIPSGLDRLLTSLSALNENLSTVTVT